MINKNDIKKNYIIKEVSLKYIEIYDNKIKLYFQDENHYQNLPPINKMLPQTDSNGYYTTYINVKPIQTEERNNYITISSNLVFIQDIYNSLKKYIKSIFLFIKTHINTHIILIPFKLISTHIKNYIEQEKKKEIINKGNIVINKHPLNIGTYTKVYLNAHNPEKYWIDIDFLYKKI